MICECLVALLLRLTRCFDLAIVQTRLHMAVVAATSANHFAREEEEEFQEWVPPG
jgi:hypothetical protein